MQYRKQLLTEKNSCIEKLITHRENSELNSSSTNDWSCIDMACEIHQIRRPVLKKSDDAMFFIAPAIPTIQHA